MLFSVEKAVKDTREDEQLKNRTEVELLQHEFTSSLLLAENQRLDVANELEKVQMEKGELMQEYIFLRDHSEGGDFVIS